MSIFDEEPKRKKVVHEIGQDLSMLSVDELGERIAILKREVERLETESVLKGAQREQASALFKI